ncbi:uncharacterized protein TrAtP1_006124 [Trichoderma atroviride]|uniref:uncharacterized protein n=1 Tax=Hypocrea atroviridis TaxID=63577 RepID=UPI0033284C3E|nr:hypothetical protein TrAtP1_006124 [Trichoderma atroviride]
MINEPSPGARWKSRAKDVVLYAAQEAQYMSQSRVHVLFISGTLFGRTFYIVADSPWPNHMDGSGLVSSTMSPPVRATKHGRSLDLLCVWGQFRQIAGQRCSRARTPGLHVLMEGEEWRNERLPRLDSASVSTEEEGHTPTARSANGKEGETDAVDTKTAERIVCRLGKWAGGDWRDFQQQTRYLSPIHGEVTAGLPRPLPTWRPGTAYSGVFPASFLDRVRVVSSLIAEGKLAENTSVYDCESYKLIHLQLQS